MNMDRTAVLKIVAIGSALIIMGYIVWTYNGTSSLQNESQSRDEGFESKEREKRHSGRKRTQLAEGFESDNVSATKSPVDIVPIEQKNKNSQFATISGDQNRDYGVQPADMMASSSMFHSYNDNLDAPLNMNPNELPKDYFPKEQLTPRDLLPTDVDSKWAQSVPSTQGSMQDINLLTSAYHIGTNTVGQSLRNANRQLRSEPPNPQMKVSPWLQSTIEPDGNRRPMEIGGGL